LNCKGAEIDRGKITNDRITEVLTRIKAAIFLIFFEIEVRRGSTKAPAIGTNTIKDKISLAFIYKQIKSGLRCMLKYRLAINKKNNISLNCETLTKIKRNT
jgi:hypothetical protein